MSQAGCLLALACLLIVVQPARADLILRYSFDETGATNTPALDTGIAPAADGTFVKSASRTSNTPLGSGLALDLTANDLDNAYVTAGNPPKLNSLSAFTLTFWINLQASPNANDRIISKIAASPAAGFEVMFYQVTSAANFNLALQVNGLTSRTLLNGVGADHQWVFMAVSYDGTTGTTNVHWYEGSPADTVSNVLTSSFLGVPVVNTTADLRVGGTPASTADRTPACWIDDVRVYNTVLALSDLETVRQGGGTNIVASGPPVFSSQPLSVAVAAGSDATFFASATGQEPISYQWLANGVAIPGATDTAYTLSNALPDYAGVQFSLMASNSVGVTNTQSATVSVKTVYDSALTTNIWTLTPGARSYVGGGYFQRGMAYDPVSADLIIADRSLESQGYEILAVIDAATATEKGYLDPSGIAGGTFGIDMVGVADDGAVYVGNLTTAANSTPYTLYRWDDDSGSAPPTIAFSGDPGGASYPGQRWGDNMAVRGAGADTQILLAPVFSTNQIVSLLTTSDGMTFQATPILLTNVPAGFAQVGLAFGPDTNTFYGKKSGGALYLVQFDLASQTGFAKKVYSTSAVGLGVTAIGVSQSLNLLGGLDTSVAPNRAPLYSIADPTKDPVIEDQKPFAVFSDNSTFGGVGAVAFGPDYMFVLDSNNGVRAFQIDTNYATLAPFSISQFSAAQGSLPTLSWPTEPGHMYQAQSKDAPGGTAWSPVGVPTLATNSSLTVTNVLLPGVGTSNRLYRVQGF